uniref:Putative mob-protein n=1 Tax=Bifidobacterium animalis TaxID=28025 RepID=Q93LB2_9BIFI|nr:putative mob-protein [Bifidobacterium animalis]
MTSTAWGTTDSTACFQPANASMATTPTRLVNSPPRACIHSRSTWAERPGTMSSSLAGLPSQRGVRSTITVTYRSPNAPWRHTCSSTPIARTEENRSACSSNSMPRSRTARSTTAHAT